jgi:hypothetical protein
VSTAGRSNNLSIPKPKNEIEMAVQMLRSFISGLRAVAQQLTIARKYKTTVAQPGIVKSPIPGAHLKCFNYAAAFCFLEQTQRHKA